MIEDRKHVMGPGTSVIARFQYAIKLFSIRVSCGGPIMKRILFFSIATLLFARGAATAQDVRYNFDKATDFSKFSTYKWVQLKDASKVDNLVDKQIRDAIDAELTTKGLTKTEDDSANLYVGYQTAVGQEKEFTSYNTGWGYGPGWGYGGWYGGMGGSSMTSGQTSTIYVGQLAVDMYDSTHKDLVWRGVASKTLDEKAKPEKRQKNLQKAMKKLFKNYPPEKK
jgi:Domain of unknown function (DUF4136)